MHQNMMENYGATVKHYFKITVELKDKDDFLLAYLLLENKEMCKLYCNTAKTDIDYLISEVKACLDFFT